MSEQTFNNIHTDFIDRWNTSRKVTNGGATNFFTTNLCPLELSKAICIKHGWRDPHPTLDIVRPVERLTVESLQVQHALPDELIDSLERLQEKARMEEQAEIEENRADEPDVEDVLAEQRAEHGIGGGEVTEAFIQELGPRGLYQQQQHHAREDLKEAEQWVEQLEAEEQQHVGDFGEVKVEEDDEMEVRPSGRVGKLAEMLGRTWKRRINSRANIQLKQFCKPVQTAEEVTLFADLFIVHTKEGRGTDFDSMRLDWNDRVLQTLMRTHDGDTPATNIFLKCAGTLESYSRTLVNSFVQRGSVHLVYAHHPSPTTTFGSRPSIQPLHQRLQSSPASAAAPISGTSPIPDHPQHHPQQPSPSPAPGRSIPCTSTRPNHPQHQDLHQCLQPSPASASATIPRPQPTQWDWQQEWIGSKEESDFLLHMGNDQEQQQPVAARVAAAGAAGVAARVTARGSQGQPVAATIPGNINFNQEQEDERDMLLELDLEDHIQEQDQTEKRSRSRSHSDAFGAGGENGATHAPVFFGGQGGGAVGAIVAPFRFPAPLLATAGGKEVDRKLPTCQLCWRIDDKKVQSKGHGVCHYLKMDKETVNGLLYANPANKGQVTCDTLKIKFTKGVNVGGRGKKLK
jgi:hypothetical protein